MNGKLYLVSTPIGNYDDITLRAIKILKSADFIICEELKEANRILSYFQIKKELFPLNEHNETEAAKEIISKLVDNKSAALISDCGTPLFSDPGHYLVRLCMEKEIDIIPVPGANSLLPSLIGSGFNLDQFYYYGWLSPNKQVRRKQLLELKRRKEIIVLLDTPYRLKSLIRDIVTSVGRNINVCLAFQLTMEDEKFYRGSAEKILNIVEQGNLKGEFVLILNNKQIKEIIHR